MSAQPNLSPIETTTPPNKPSLWTPTVASLWSLMFTPAFGSYIHMLNWKAIGNTQKAKECKIWFGISIALLVAYIIAALLLLSSSSPQLDAMTVDGISRAVLFIYLIVWYFSSAREQEKYVKNVMQDNYTKKSWSDALWCAVGGLIVFYATAMLIGFLYSFISAYI